MVASVSPNPNAAELGAELEAALVRELRSTYADLNATFFRRKLKPATFELSDASTRLGRWVPEMRTIEVSRKLVSEEPWGVVVEVLKHEMAHQFVHEVLGKHDESAHGPAFRELCARMGIDASAAGMPRAGATTSEEGRVLERISRLLALAESANVHEAQAAMSAAQKLMLKHNLDVVAAREKRGYGFRHLGKPTGRVSEAERRLGSLLEKHFFVEVIWVPVYRPLEQKRGSVLEVCGTPANLEMAEYVYSFLTHAAEHLWKEHKKQKGIRHNKDRRVFFAGVMAGFMDKLDSERVVHKEQGLVWAGDAELETYYRQRHPRISMVRHAGSQRTEAHAHGREAGKKLVLYKPVEGKASGSVKLLGR